MQSSRTRYRLTATVVATFALSAMIWSFVPNGVGRVAAVTGHQTRPIYQNFDIRYDKTPELDTVLARQRAMGDEENKASLREKRPIVMREAEDILSRSVRGVKVDYNDILGSPMIVTASTSDVLSRASGRSRETTARSFLAANRDLFGLSDSDIKQYALRADAPNPNGDLSYVYLERKVNGIPFFRSEITAAFTRDGDLFRTVGEITPGINTAELDKEAAMSPQQAVAAAASRIGFEIDPASLTLLGSEGNKYVFERGPFSYDIPVELNYFPIEPGVAALAWNVMLVEDNPGYLILIDANDGTLYFRKNLTSEQTQQATYVVYGSDSPAPLSPVGNNLSGTTPVDQGAAVGRTSFSLISQLSATDPWLNDGDNITTGNNVDSGMDLVSPDGIDAGTRAVGNPARIFDFAYDPAPGFVVAPGQAPTLADYRFGEAVNMFFWTNHYHDILYNAGFTETSRNFQQNNYGRGGLGNDRVLAQGQDFSSTNNANFLTPPDGTSGRMQMFIFTGPNPDRSSGLDQEIVIHELTHGTSNRLHGNAAGLNFAQGGGMGEGWSDFYARVILSTADEDIGGVYGAGGYSTPLIVAGFNSNYYYGIRRFPYALRSTVGVNGNPHNPLTFADVDASKISLTDGAFPRGPIGSATAHAVHNVGEVWCMNLLEVRAKLIALHGFDAGNQRTLQLVTDGMKLSPADPTMLQARDAILAASAASGGTAAEQDAIWEGFAVRGMGFGATVSAANSSPITVNESFLTPNLTVGSVTLAEEDCPDENGAPDPGETVQFAVEVDNTLLAENAENVTVEIVGGGNANYGTIAATGSGTQNISYTVPTDAECGSLITLTININSSLGPVSYTHTFQVGMPTGKGPAESSSTGNLATPINDNATLDIPINVTQSGSVGDVNVKVRLNHSFNGDLEVRLVAPDGTSVMLADNRGGSGDNYGSGANDCSGTFTVFDDAAGNTIASGTAPFAGAFRPDSPLSAFSGKEMNGTWILRVTDTATLDTGTVGCAQIDISEQFYYCCGIDGDPVIQSAPPAVMIAESVAPANGSPDPDEVVTMSFPMVNVGSGSTTDLVATLLPSGGITPLSGPQSYGGFSPTSPAVTRDFTFVGQGDCGTDVVATFALSDDGVDLGTVSYTIRLGATVVGNASFSSAAAIAVPAPPSTGASTGAPASPYPSTIAVSGITGTVTKVTASVTGLSHTFPADIDMVLVGPGGQKAMLMSDVGGGTDVVNANLTFDDAAAGIGSTVVSGTFRPTNSGTGDPFPAPGPAAPHGNALSAFNGIDPNGDWRLFIVDDAGADTGSVSGGWSLSITTADPVCNSASCELTVTDITVPNDPGEPGAVVEYPIVVNGSSSIGVSGSCGVVTASPASGSFFTVGTTDVTVTAVQTGGSTTTAAFNVTVNDVEAPVITNASITPASLWPANHRMVRIQVSYQATDNFTPSENLVRSLRVKSNEPINGTGDGDTAPDWSILGPNSLMLRAERSGRGSGRIYTVTIVVADQFGNTATQDLVVTVPHDRRFQSPLGLEVPKGKAPTVVVDPSPVRLTPAPTLRRNVMIAFPEDADPEQEEKAKAKPGTDN